MTSVGDWGEVVGFGTLINISSATWMMMLCCSCNNSHSCWCFGALVTMDLVGRVGMLGILLYICYW